MHTKYFLIGDRVIYQGKIYTVLGCAASTDENGLNLLEIDWTDYLAVSHNDLDYADEMSQLLYI